MLFGKYIVSQKFRNFISLEDPYVYYYAEELGFFVWAEMPSVYTFCEREGKAKTQEWQEIVSTNDRFDNLEKNDILFIYNYDIKRKEEFSVKYNGHYEGICLVCRRA